MIHVAKTSPLVHLYDAYTTGEIADMTFDYLVYGVRPTDVHHANDRESPLERWLLSPAPTRCSLAHYVAVLTKGLLWDLLRQRWRVRQQVRKYHQRLHPRPDKRQTIATTAESVTGTRALHDVSSPVEESVLLSHLADGWIRQLTEREQEILRLTAPMYDGWSQTEAAKRLRTSNATLSRRLRLLRTKFQDFLEGA